MFVKLLILTSAIASTQCTGMSHYIKGPWKNDIKKCGSGGEDRRSYIFYLLTLDSIGLKYNDIKQSTTVMAHGRLQLYTRGTGIVKEAFLTLTTYDEYSDYKIFSTSWEETGNIGWGSQISKLVLTLKIYKYGRIELINYVYAGSWWSITCAETKAYVDKIEIITEDNSTL